MLDGALSASAGRRSVSSSEPDREAPLRTTTRAIRIVSATVSSDLSGLIDTRTHPNDGLSPETRNRLVGTDADWNWPTTDPRWWGVAPSCADSALLVLPGAMSSRSQPAG